MMEEGMILIMTMCKGMEYGYKQFYSSWQKSAAVFVLSQYETNFSLLSSLKNMYVLYIYKVICFVLGI